MSIQERYTPVAMAANTSYTVGKQSIGGFICVTAGTLTVIKNNQAATVLLNAVPVTAGQYLPLPIFLGPNGGTVTLAGGAVGSILI